MDSPGCFETICGGQGFPNRVDLSGRQFGQNGQNLHETPTSSPLTMGNPWRYILKKGSHDLSTSLIRKVFLSKSSLKHNLSTDSLTGVQRWRFYKIENKILPFQFI